MPGKWEFVFELRAGGKTDRLASAFQLSQFTQEEIAKILQHGPWPPPPARDPSNRVSGKREAIALRREAVLRAAALGHRLGAVRHLPRAVPRVPGRAARAPSACRTWIATRRRVLNARFYRWYGWDGGARQPVVAEHPAAARRARDERDAARMWPGSFARFSLRSTKRHSHARFPPSDEASPGRCRQGAGGVPGDAGQRPHAVRRISRCAGARPATRAIRSSAKRGLKIFVGKGNCSTCHFGPHFTNGEFADTGIAILRRAGARRCRAAMTGSSS